ncbi:MAG: hypothetical protein K2M60_03840 [Lachnospiraceae bacterium]|nr:hypothetical protein [Lachnospiraceae bacterium]MDE6252761.1 hypothetical protein [Lachnospiraceae bacterium]
MNREQIYVAFRKKVESNEHYFKYEKYGIIEETLAYFGLTSKEFKGTSSWVHEDNLKTLHDFMINEATDEQLKLIYQVATGAEKMPEINPSCPHQVWYLYLCL